MHMSMQQRKRTSTPNSSGVIGSFITYTLTHACSFGWHLVWMIWDNLINQNIAFFGVLNIIMHK